MTALREKVESRVLFVYDGRVLLIKDHAFIFIGGGFLRGTILGFGPRPDLDGAGLDAENVSGFRLLRHSRSVNVAYLEPKGFLVDLVALVDRLLIQALDKMPHIGPRYELVAHRHFDTIGHQLFKSLLKLDLTLSVKATTSILLAILLSPQSLVFFLADLVLFLSEIVKIFLLDIADMHVHALAQTMQLSEALLD